MRVDSIGFTGTQIGMTQAQKNVVKRLSNLLYEHGCAFHHGDCIGSDEQAHKIFWKGCYKVFIHPPISEEKRAFCRVPKDAIYEPKEYLERDKDIVDACQFLIATPKDEKERMRSGTWATIRYARLGKRNHVVIFPSGRTELFIY